MVKSIEERVEDHFKAQLVEYKIQYFCKTDRINDAIDKALSQAESKSGGTGRNYPDIKIVLKTASNRCLPVMLEAKGTKGKLIKLDKNGKIELIGPKGQRTAITDFAVNGAVHYVNAILDEGTYHEALAVGLNGYEDNGETKYEAAIFYISEDNAREPIQLKQYSDLSCLTLGNLSKLVEELDNIHLTEDQREELKRSKHTLLERKIKEIHQSIYDDDDLKSKLGTNDKLYLFSGLIMAGLPIQGSADLTVSDLKGNNNDEDNDGSTILRRIKVFLTAKRSPTDKVDMILRLLSGVFTNKLLWRPINDESKIKKIFRDISEGVVPILKLRLNVDFTGIILNSLKDWLELDNDKKNDVVLTLE